MSESSQKEGPKVKTVEELFAFQDQDTNVEGYFHILFPSICKPKLGDAYIIGEPGGDLTNVFKDMHNMACFLVLRGYDIYWIYTDPAAIQEALPAAKPKGDEQQKEPKQAAVFLFFAGHGKVSDNEYTFLGRGVTEILKLGSVNVKEYVQKHFICLATCVTEDNNRGIESNIETLKEIFRDVNKLVLWAPRTLEQQKDKSEKRIAQVLVKHFGSIFEDMFEDMVKNLNFPEFVTVPVVKCYEKQEIKPICPEVLDNDDTVLFQSDFSTYIAYFTYFQSREKSEQKRHWEEIINIIRRSHKKIKDAGVVQRFWYHYAVSQPEVPNKDVEKSARCIAKVLNCTEEEVQKSLEGIKEDVKNLPPAITKDWVQLKILSFLVRISQSSVDREDPELEESVGLLEKELKDTGLEFSAIKNQTYLSESFWSYLQQQLRTLAQGKKPLEPETYEAIAYFLPDDKQWLTALANLVRANGEMMKSLEDHKKELCNQLKEELCNQLKEELCNQLKVVVQEVAQEKVDAAMLNRTKTITDQIDGQIKRLDGRIGEVAEGTTIAGEITRLGERIGELAEGTTIAGEITGLGERIGDAAKGTGIAGEITKLYGRITWGFLFGLIALGFLIVVLNMLF